MKTIAAISLCSVLAFLGIASPTAAQNYGPPKKIYGAPPDIEPMLIGVTINTVDVNNPDGSSYAINEDVFKKPTVLYYYRGGWDPYATAYLKKLQELKKPLEDLGYQIIAMSPDRPSKAKETVQKLGLTYKVASDSDVNFGKNLGIAYLVNDQTLQLYKEKNKWDIEAASGKTHHVLPVPTVFLLDSRAVVRFSYANPNYKVQLDPSVLTAAAKFVEDEEHERHKAQGQKEK